MESDMKPEPTEFQKRARSFLYYAVTETVQTVGDFINSLPPGVVVGACVASLTALYAHAYSVLPWVVWRHIVVDTLAFLVLPLLLAVLCNTAGHIKNYLGPEDSDLELHVWQGRKYYEYVGTTTLRRAALCCDVRKEDRSEKETKEITAATS